MLPTKKGIRDAALDKMSDVIINDIAAGTKERNELLSVYNDQIKDKISKIVNQHKIAGAIAGPLPTHGILTSVNLIVLYSRLSSTLDVKVMQELDAVVGKVLSSCKWSFLKLGTQLAIIKQFVSFMDESVIALPLGVALGLWCGYKFTHRAGLGFASKIDELVDKAYLDSTKGK